MNSRRPIAAPLCILLLIAFIVIQSSAAQCYCPPSPDTGEVRIFAQSVCGSVDNGPPNPTLFTIDAPTTITKIGTYHWNYGAGATPGTIGLQDQNGNVYGPWQSSGEPGSGGVQNAYWVVTLANGIDLSAGTYEVLDSDPSTWAYNSESGDSGVVSIVGLSASGANHNAGNKNTGQPPCAADAVDFSPTDPTDLYHAGPLLVPGSYKIYCGKRTGTQIGKPDGWQTYGPVDLHGGKFYVFDLENGVLSEQDPKMINVMAYPLAPTESQVWYRLSNQYAYVVCFDGPLSGNNGGLQLLVGAWKMAGHQEGFNDWKADLVLNSDSNLSWTETQGANVGATRSGTWQFDGTTFTMNWVSPDGGQTTWTSKEVTKDTINSGTYTVEYAPGGTWSATRSYTGVNEGL